MNPLSAATAALPTVQLREIVAALFTDSRDGAGLAFEAALNELERRLPEAEFVALCESF